MQKILTIGMLLMSLIGSEALAKDIDLRWSDFAEEFNHSAGLIDSDFEMFDIGSEILEQIEAEEEKMVVERCNPVDVSDYVISEELTAVDFADYLTTIAFDIDLAAGADQERIDGFTDLLLEMASIANGIFNVTSSGGCNGRWSNSYYIFQIADKSYSISIGVE